MKRTFSTALLVLLLASTAAASAATYQCKTICRYGPYRCLTNEGSRTYRLTFSPDDKTVTVAGGEAPGTFRVNKGAFYWRWSGSGGGHPVSYIYRRAPDDLRVEITYYKGTASGTAHEINYYTGSCSRI